MPISILYQAPLDSGETLAELGPLDFASEPTDTDAISRILASTPPAEVFGRYWTDQVTRGLDALEALPADRYLDVQFEALLETPREVLARIADFFEYAWAPKPLEAAVRLVRTRPAARFDRLSPREHTALAAACAPGQKRLGR